MSSEGDNSKLDKLINTLSTVVQKLDKLARRFSNIEDRFTNLDSRLSRIEDQISDDENKISKLESDLTKVDETTEILKSRIDTLQTNMKQFKVQTKHDSLSRDSYSKRFNFLIQGIEEDSSNTWERQEQTEQIFENFWQVWN